MAARVVSVSKFISQTGFYSGGGNSFRPREISHLAVFVEEIELSGPVASHDENIDFVFLYIIWLLLPIVFGNHQVNVADGFYDYLSLFICAVALFVF